MDRAGENERATDALKGSKTTPLALVNMGRKISKNDSPDKNFNILQDKIIYNRTTVAVSCRPSEGRTHLSQIGDFSYNFVIDLK